MKKKEKDIFEKQGWIKVGERMYKHPDLDDDIWNLGIERNHINIIETLTLAIEQSLKIHRIKDKDGGKVIKIQTKMIKEELKRLRNLSQWEGMTDIEKNEWLGTNGFKIRYPICL